MAKKKQTKLPVPQNMKMVRGRGDFTDATPKNPVQTISRIEAKVDKLLDSKKSSGGAGSMIGRGLGSLVGNGDLGAAAGDAVAKWFGYGDYDLKTNSLIKAVSEGSMIPTFSKDGRRGTRIVEREYLGDVVSGSSNTFTNGQYRLNPADSKTFPWLSAIAAQYEEWEPNGIIFEFKTTSGTYSGTSQALGTVIMMTDYDVSDPAPLNKLQMENADYSCSTVSSGNLQHGVECDPSERAARVLFCSTTPLSGADAKFHDLGNFNVATAGVSAASVTLGELWVSYDITFYKKQLIAGQFGNTNNFSIIQPTTTSYVDGLITAANLLGPEVNVYGTFRMGFNTTTRTLSFPTNIATGRYLVTYISNGSTPPTLGASTYTNCALLTKTTDPAWSEIFLPLGGSSFGFGGPIGDGLNYIISRVIQINASGASIAYATGATPVDVTCSMFWVVQLPMSSLTQLQ